MSATDAAEMWLSNQTTGTNFLALGVAVLMSCHARHHVMNGIHVSA